MFETIVSVNFLKLKRFIIVTYLYIYKYYNGYKKKKSQSSI